MDKHPQGVRTRIVQWIKQSLWISAAWLAAIYLMPAHAQSISTFGRTSESNTTPSAGLAGDFKRASRFTLTEPATVKHLCAYLDGKGGASGSQEVKLALYTDANGAPATRVFDTEYWSIGDGEAPRWICPTTFYVAAIPAGKYWIAILSSGPGGIVRAFSTGSAQNWYSNADSYDDGPSNPFGAGSLGTGTLAAYVRYYPESQVRNVGRTSIGAQVSNGMIGNFKRASSFVMPERGKLFAITAYLDGRGSSTSSAFQSYRYVIYKDSSGVPGERVFEGSTGSVGVAAKPRWITEGGFPYRAPTLEAGRYWLGIHSGDTGLLGETGGLIRYYYDYAGKWYGNDDLFTDGAATPFGVGTTKNHTISAFISYRPGTITTGELGRTDVGTTPSRALDPDFLRWSGGFPMYDINATLTGLHAYLDGLGSTSGSQDVRMVLYGSHAIDDGTGAGDLQYYKVAESAPITIAAGMQPRWVKFTVPPVALNLYENYLIGIHTSGPKGVARDYGDNRFGAFWNNRPDTFADGAAESFLRSDPSIGDRGNVTLSVYASYSLPPP
jgi:hypothetical protein